MTVLITGGTTQSDTLRISSWVGSLIVCRGFYTLSGSISLIYRFTERYDPTNPKLVASNTKKPSSLSDNPINEKLV